MFTFKRIAAVVAIAITAVLIYAATTPDTFQVQRSASISAPPEKILPYLNDFQKAAAWVPYEKRDPAMKRSFSGAPTGKGSVYNFEGNSEAGTGRLEILDSTPNKVTVQLDMTKPFAVSNTIEYTLEPQGADTRITWAMHGTKPYIAKVIGVFIDCDKMVGKDFETGLASLKALTEKKS